MYIEDYIRRVLFLKTLNKDNDYTILSGAVGDLEECKHHYADKPGSHIMTIWPKDKFSPEDPWAIGAHAIYINPADVLDLIEVGVVRWLSKEDSEWNVPEANSENNDEEDY